MYTDFRDLKDACSKDEFPLLITDVMLYNTYSFERIFLMHGFSGYNQIKMYDADEKYTFFQTLQGIYC